MHQFNITYNEGFPRIENTYCDSNKLVHNLNEYNIKIFRIYEKEKYDLKHKLNNFGMITLMQSFPEKIHKQLMCDLNVPFASWHIPFFFRFLIPYHIEISYNNQLLFTNSLDLRSKLVLFNLDSEDLNDLNVWMNAIGIFKKKMKCDIAIRNDIINETTDYDDIADIKYKKNEQSIAHYHMLNIGRYYLPNSNIADPFFHPDGLKDKNALEIINDILYYSGTLFID